MRKSNHKENAEEAASKTSKNANRRKSGQFWHSKS